MENEKLKRWYDNRLLVILSILFVLPLGIYAYWKIVNFKNIYKILLLIPIIYFVIGIDSLLITVIKKKFFNQPEISETHLIINQDSIENALVEIDIPSITIESQTFMNKNLSVTFFSNGDSIKEAKTNEEWLEAYKNKEPAWCYYDNDSINNEKFGKLYNWYAASDNRNICPEGWHVPSKNEWLNLIDILGGKDNAASKLSSSEVWNGDDEFGFSALPAGGRLIIDNRISFKGLRKNAQWWTSNEINSNEAESISIFKNYLNNAFELEYERFWWLNTKGVGYSIRCLKD